jgi:hypothetical protein
VCWKPCLSCWSLHLLREEFLSAPIHSPPLWITVSVLQLCVKGTPVVSLNTVTSAVHIRLLARQIHNARILPAVASTRPAHLRHSLPAAALLFSIPTAPCMTTVTRTRLLACRRISDQPKTVDMDPSTSSSVTTTSRPPQATSRRGSGLSGHHENNYFIRDRG